MNLRLYPGPETIQDASREDLLEASEKDRDLSLRRCTEVSIQVNGEDLFVYETNVNHSRSWDLTFLPLLSRTPVASFDFAGEAVITIRFADTFADGFLEKVCVRPLKYGIVPKLDRERRTVSFPISQPDAYSVEVNDSPKRAIHLFANRMDLKYPDPDREDVLYFGPGEWFPGTIEAKDGQTIVLAGGAVVHGDIRGDHVKDVTVLGRGILDGSLYEGWKAVQEKARVPLRFDHCERIVIKDILVVNANAWVCQGFDTRDLLISGLKIISCRPNGDGITLQSCKDVKVEHCFVRTWDDSLVVKNYEGNSERISFSDIQIWTDFAQSMEIGYETNRGCRENSVIRDIFFQDICVLHNFHKPVLSIHNADEALVENISYRDIVIEDAEMGSGDGACMPYLIDFIISGDLGWATTKKRGWIRKILLENVNVLSGICHGSRIAGCDQTHQAADVLIKNLTILGVPVKSLEDGKFETDPKTTKNIVIE